MVPLRVLVVEDLPAMAELINDLLRSMQRFQLAAILTTEAEAKLWLDEHPGEWDVAIVDLVLASGSGFGVIKKAREMAATEPILVFSGYVSPGVETHCLELGATAVIDKARSQTLLEWFDRLGQRGPRDPA